MMNGNSGEISNAGRLRERKKPPRDGQADGQTVARGALLQEDKEDQKTFGKTPDGAGE